MFPEIFVKVAFETVPVPDIVRLLTLIVLPEIKLILFKLATISWLPLRVTKDPLCTVLTSLDTKTVCNVLGPRILFNPDIVWLIRVLMPETDAVVSIPLFVKIMLSIFRLP